MIGWIAYRSARGMSREYGRSAREFAAAPAVTKARVIALTIVFALAIPGGASLILSGTALAIWLVIEVSVARTNRQLDALDPHRNTLTIGEAAAGRRRAR